ncbi:MAG: GxxExxY protein [Holophagaceae bacterium]|nr:GxxExxY protein [Holophagaceae bacterium]
MAEGSGGFLEEEELTGTIIGAAIKVQRSLGNGLLESAYEACLAYELRHAGLKVETQVPLEIRYESMVLPNAYRLDAVVNDSVLLELKTIEMILPVHEAQLLTYLRFRNLRLGLILNFWSWPLKDHGIKRILNPMFS